MSDLVVYKSILVALVLLGLVVAERYLPAVNVPETGVLRGRIAKNLSLWLINSLVSPVIILPVTFYAINYGGSYGIGWRGDHLESWAFIGIDLLILDLWIYWWHRANHRLAFLWRFHRVHHLDRWLDVTSSVRFHFGELVLSALVRAVVIACLGIPIISVIIFESLVLMNSGFHHSNVRIPKRIEERLSRFIVTPSIHWVHHHVVKSDTDSNYGTLFSFWDRLFGSYSKNKRTSDMDIGLERCADMRFFELLVSPFTRR